MKIEKLGGEKVIENNTNTKPTYEELRTIADYTYDWEYWVDDKGEFVYVSPSSERISSYKPNEFYEDSKLLQKIVHPDDRELILNHKHNLDKTGISTPIEFRIITKKKEIQWIDHVCQQVFGENGELLGVRGSNRIITKRKKIELALKESEENYRKLFNENPLSLREEDCSEVKKILDNTKNKGINITKEYLDSNPDFVAKCLSAVKILNINKASLSLLGYKNIDDLLNNKKNKVYNERTIETIKNEILAFANNQKSYTEETELVCANGEVKSVISQFNVINDYEKIIFSITDITKLKEIEKALKESEEHLQEINATKDKFFSIISHDLKNPFNSILGFIDLLSRNFEKYDNEKRKKYIDIIKNESQLSVNLLTNLLEWSMVQTGRMKYDPEKLDIIEVLNKEFEIIYLKAKRKNIKISVVKDNNYIINADRNMISTIFRNLLSNAVKFTPQNGAIKVTLSKQIVDEDNENIKITVSDTGVGISQQNVKRLFKIGENASSVGVEGEKGTGLGLILCKEFIEKHDGEIWIESEEGQGSKFIFTIPVIS